jgi:hypothetical protein
VELARARRAIVKHAIERFLAAYPRAKQEDPELGLCVYPISRTPFVVLYDYDDIELRVHFIFHRRADLRDLDPSSVEW